MKKSVFVSFVFACCVFVFGGTLVLRYVNKTYAIGASQMAIEYYYVTFDLDGGKGSVGTQNIQQGKNFTVDKPKNPTKSGHTFKHWSTSPGGSAYDFSQPVTKSFTLYAVWEKKEVAPTSYTIRFDTMGGSSVSNQNVSAGGKVMKPSNPSRTGYTFKYWSKSSSGSAYDFGSKVNSSFTLYAVWELVQVTPPSDSGSNSGGGNSGGGGTSTKITYYNVSFDLNGGSGSASLQKIAKGNKVTKPSDPVKDKANFLGWYTDKTCNNVYDFSKNVSSEFTLYACYVSNYTVTFNRQGLPFIYNYTETFKEKSNLSHYMQDYNLLLFDTTTYSMKDIDSCPSVLGDINYNFSSSELTEKCNNFSSMFNCNNSKCYGGKYIMLTQLESEDILYLNNKEVISVDYDIYKYLGLYTDNECSSDYSYSSDITGDLEVYECYQYVEKDDEVIPTPKPKKERKGLSGPWIMIIIAFLALAGFFGYIVIKSKIANRVD